MNPTWLKNEVIEIDLDVYSINPSKSSTCKLSKYPSLYIYIYICKVFVVLSCMLLHCDFGIFQNENELMW